MYSYSDDGELFHGDFSTPEGAAIDAFNDDPELVCIEVGENHKSPAAFYVSADSILEDIAQRAYEECGDIAEDWLQGLMRDKEKLAELEKLVGDWIDSNEPPSFWRIENTKTITRAEMVSGGHMNEVA